MPEEVRVLIRDGELGNSGAMVTSLIDDDRLDSPYVAKGEVSHV